MSKPIHSVIVISTLNGYPNHIVSSAISQSSLQLVPLQSETLQDREMFLSTVQHDLASSKTPYLISSVRNAFSIQDQFPDIPFTFLFVAPNSIGDYLASISQCMESDHDKIRILKEACQECDLLWKYDSIISVSNLKSMEELFEDSNEYAMTFDVLAFKESLTSNIQKLQGIDTEDL